MLGWPTDLGRDYDQDEVIGLGSFGTVHAGTDKRSKQRVAIKIMPKQRGEGSREKTVAKLVKEVAVMQELQDCPSLVRLLACYETADEVQVVMEHCAGGDIQQLSEDCGDLPERVVALIAHEVVRVVAACHARDILHGDIKPANFILRDRKTNPLGSPNEAAYYATPWLAAIDLGCAQHLGPDHFVRRCGTPLYMAPEIFRKDYHVEADMYSVGVMLYQLYCHNTAQWQRYEATRSEGTFNETSLDAPLPLDYGPWRSMSPEGLDFVRRCLQRDWAKRLTARQALRHPWFAKWVPAAARAAASPGLAAAQEVA